MRHLSDRELAAAVRLLRDRARHVVVDERHQDGDPKNYRTRGLEQSEPAGLLVETAVQCGTSLRVEELLLEIERRLEAR